ncbi:ribonuclease P protein component [bacterium]|nr:ribonuclease P protein component [bacterium]MBU1983447.1 ribonuclease P protein component [bacterium]
MAFAATRAVGNAPQRHRHIRKLREYYRLNKEFFPAQSHIFILVRRPVADWKDLEARLAKLLQTLAKSSHLDSEAAD